MWTDLAAVSSEALLKSHISALHDLLHVAAAAGAAGGHGPPSPLYSQLLGLLACLLAAAPAPTQDAFFAHFLQASACARPCSVVRWASARSKGLNGSANPMLRQQPFHNPAHFPHCWPQALGKMRDDACQLACLAADLRLATLVDATSGSAAAAPQVQGVLATLFRWLTEVAPKVMKRAGSAGAGGQAADTAGAEGEILHLAWLLEALHCAAAYFAATGRPQVSRRWTGGQGCWLGLARRRREATQYAPTHASACFRACLLS